MLDEKFASEFFCLYFIGSLHAITEHREVVLKGVFAANLLPDGINRVTTLVDRENIHARKQL